MSTFSERVAALSPAKQAQLLQKLRQTAGSVKQEDLAPVDPWVVRPLPNEEAALRLFCFPYAGGSASIFRQWPEALPSVEVCSIQLPGREQRLGEPAYTHMADLLVDLTMAITPYLDRPFAFFGHSMGALISFALTCHLRETLNLSPAHLFLSAFRAAHLPNPNIKIAHLPVEVFKVVLRADGIAETILQNEELMEAMLPTLRADLALCDTYAYQAQMPLLCPVTVFGGLEDVRVGQNDLEAWRSHFQGPFRLQMFSGTHFFLHSAQDPLLAALSHDLECYTGLIKEQSYAR